MTSSLSAGSVLGIDASTQSLSAVLLDAATGHVQWTHTIAYRDDARLCGMGFEHSTLIMPPREMGEAEQPPKLFIAALEALFDDLKKAGVSTQTIRAVNVSGQQHGHVYLNETAKTAFGKLCGDTPPDAHLTDILGEVFAYGGAPIWKTANTALEAEEICARAGGRQAVIELTGSNMPLRFSACAHRKIAKRYPEAWRATKRIVQISSLIPAILAGDSDIPLDYGNACGTGLMNYAGKDWDNSILEAVAGDLPGGVATLRAKLPSITHPLTIVGKLAAWFVKRYDLPLDCAIVAGSGDNPQSKVLAHGDLLSLGTSFVYMMATPEGSIDMTGSANAMYDGLGRPFNFCCRTNGALVWDRLRQLYAQPPRDYAASEEALGKVVPGSVLRFWHPDTESFPVINASHKPVRIDDQAVDFAHDYAGVVDSSLGLVYCYGQKIAADAKNAQPISVCGGPSTSQEIMKRIAAIWNRPVIQAGQAGAALGAAVAAAIAIIPNDDASREKATHDLRQLLFADKRVTLPDSALVKHYHAKGGYLEKLEASFERLRHSS